LNDYAVGTDENAPSPVQEKNELFVLLDEAIAKTVDFCTEHEVSISAILQEREVFKHIDLFRRYADILLGKEEWRKTFNVYENTLSSLYEACKPEVFKQPQRPEIAVIQYLRGVIDSLVEQANIDEVTQKISELLDESLVVNNAEKFAIREHQAEYKIVQKGKTWDLSKIDFDKLREDFGEAKYKNIEIADLHVFIEDKLRRMMEQNHTRVDFAQKLQEIVDRYNSGGSSTENYYEDLVRFTQEMKEEDSRHIREGLTENELELFDLIKKDNLTKDEEQKVKLAAKDLLIRLLEEHPKVLVQDWWKDGQTQRAVRNAIEEVLDRDLPDSYDRATFIKKVDNVFELIVEFAANQKKWVA